MSIVSAKRSRCNLGPRALVIRDGSRRAAGQRDFANAVVVILGAAFKRRGGDR